MGNTVEVPTAAAGGEVRRVLVVEVVVLPAIGKDTKPRDEARHKVNRVQRIRVRVDMAWYSISLNTIPWKYPKPPQKIFDAKVPMPLSKKKERLQLPKKK
jgi:hypothetical protein